MHGAGTARAHFTYRLQFPEMGDPMSARLSPDPPDWLPEIDGGPQGFGNEPLGPSWPEPLAPEAFHGLAGEIVSLIEPLTEADPAGLLLHLLVSFGNMVGRAPHFR